MSTAMKMMMAMMLVVQGPLGVNAISGEALEDHLNNHDDGGKRKYNCPFFPWQPDDCGMSVIHCFKSGNTSKKFSAGPWYGRLVFLRRIFLRNSSSSDFFFLSWAASRSFTS